MTNLLYLAVIPLIGIGAGLTVHLFTVIIGKAGNPRGYMMSAIAGFIGSFLAVVYVVFLDLSRGAPPTYFLQYFRSFVLILAFASALGAAVIWSLAARLTARQRIRYFWGLGLFVIIFLYILPVAVAFLH
jgi:hypothetical protein